MVWPTADFYRDHILNVLLPFWRRYVDTEFGGVMTCLDNWGKELLSDDKYVWSQGRFLWIWSRLAELCRRGLLPLGEEAFAGDARRTAEFLSRYAFMPNGNCIFLLRRDGSPKETGARPDSSIYADCFVCLGLNEYGRVFGDEAALDRAAQLYSSIARRVRANDYATEPYPVPKGSRIMGIPMFATHCGQELLRPNADVASFAEDVLKNFFRSGEEPFEGNREVLFSDASSDDTLLARHMTPGHTLECSWFLVHLMEKTGDFSAFGSVERAARYALEKGLDREQGGLFRYVDRAGGGEVWGRLVDDPYERLIVKTWDTKLWWVHSEALYCCRLMARYGDGEYWRKRYSELHDYTFATFPSPDASVGEWIQIRRRDRTPLSEVVALPVKDPYHILRCMTWLLEEASR